MDERICINKTHCEGDAACGDKCEQPCELINSNCKICSRYAECLSCEDTGFYGIYCNKLCENWIDGCDIEEISGNKIECKEDLFYGEKCDKPCKELNSKCKTCTKKIGINYLILIEHFFMIYGNF